MLPPLTPINDTDLATLDAFRIERFRAFFAESLSRATLYLSGLDRTFIISSISPIVLEILSDREYMLRVAWLTLAATRVKVYVGDERAYEAEALNCTLGEKVRGERMATATAELEIVQVNGSKQDIDNSRIEMRDPLPSCSVDEIALDLEQEPEEIREFLVQSGASLLTFKGQTIVSASDADAVYDHYGRLWAQNKKRLRFAASSGAPATVNNPKATKNTAAKEVKPKKPTITWKQPFKTNRSYAKTIQNALNSLFPNDATEQQQALSDLVQQNDMGKAYLDKIIRAGAYKNRESARSNLLKASVELVKTDNAAGGEEEKVEAAV